jgi:hypothetical protein
MAASVPRLVGRSLRLVARLIRTPAGPSLRRSLAAQVLDRRLAGLQPDVEPYYFPPRYRRP